MKTLRSMVKIVLVGVALSAAFWVGSRFGPAPLAAPQAGVKDQADAGAIEYWTCSMHPQIRQRTPGQCPICGMDLVPVTTRTAEPRAKKVKYACSMMCVPPVDRPGKCPVCGMDMVPVEEHGDDTEAGLAAGGNALSEIGLSERAQRLARLETAAVERRFVTAEIRMVGKVDYDETRQRTITSRVPGRLDRLYVNYTGIPVKEGEHLVYLYSPDLLAAQSELIELVRAVRDVAPQTAERAQRARADWLEAGRQKLRLWGLTQEQIEEIEQRGTPSDHLTIYAPIGGIVIDKRVVEGAYVETGTEIYTIADLSHVWVKLDAYEIDLAWLRYRQDVEFSVEACPGETFHGTIAFIDPILNTATRTSKVRVNVPNEDGRLKPGMFVRAVVRSQLTADGSVVMDNALAGQWICPMHPEVVGDGPGECSDCGMPLAPAESLGYAPASPAGSDPPLVIPATAPLITGRRAVVYVASPDRPGQYQGREVALGPRAGDYYLVQEGLVEGEWVVTRGNLAVDSAVQILAKQSMMNPGDGGPPPEHAHGSPDSQPASTESDDAAAMNGELPDSAVATLDAVYTAYLAAQHALSHDQFEAAKEATGRLVAAVEALSATGMTAAAANEWGPLQVSLRESGRRVGASQDIDSARAAFEGVSNSLISAAGKFGTGSRSRVLVYYCPMAFDNRGARWLQEKEGVENPYFGSAMFRCGVLKETIAGGAKREGPGE